ncbi:MAG: sulfotransferase [Saprospiraceae bacterium]
MNKAKLKIIIGGSASTGSSLLAHLLNQHSQVYCGPETNLLTHPDWLLDWGNAQNIIMQSNLNTLMSSGWHVHKGIQIDHLIKGRPFASYVEQSKDYQSFIHNIYSNVLIDQKINVIAEKTPSNAICLHLLQRHFPKTQRILTVRNPYDAIASMYKRGWSIPYACGLYLFNISIGFEERGNLKIVKYEDLIENKKNILTDLLKTNDLPYEKNMELMHNEIVPLPSWVQYEPTNTDMFNTFDTISKQDQQSIIYFITHLKFRSNFTFYGKTPAFNNVEEIMFKFGYAKTLNSKIMQFVRQKNITRFGYEKLKRKLKNYPLSGNKFPFKIH